MKMKVLSPAGNLTSVKMAIYNGADEIYLGVKDFNARNNIEGLSLEDVKTAVDLAHIYNVRVFLTVNILFTNEELNAAIDLIVKAYNLGVDAFIMQDIGLISIISTNYPEIEIHASTQLAVHNLEGVRELEKFNIKRVVLSRETPLSEIRRIRENSNIEIEYFVHGALCVGFSGNCYMSSYMFNASGNRGKCKQLCRLPYDLYFENEKIKSGYLLSAKDNNMLNRLEDLRLAGVNSLKIEGRARRPYYVGAITKIYRNAVDGLPYNEEDIKLAFNRGFTEGYFNGNGEIISNIQNHIGVEVGMVTSFYPGKKFNEIYFNSNVEISPKSTLKFFLNSVEIATISAYDLTKTETGYKLTTTQQVKVGATVNLIADYKKETEMENFVFKRPINIEITAVENEKLKVKTEIDGKVIELEGEICEVAKSRPITEEELIENFNKNEYFSVKINANMGNVFILKKQLNEFRRNFFENVEKVLTEINRKELIPIIVEEKTSYPLKNFMYVDKPISSRSPVTIYTPNEFNLEEISHFKLECEKVGSKAFVNLPNFVLCEDIVLLKNIIEKTKVGVVVNNLYALSFNAEKIIGGAMNVFNSYTAECFNLPYLVAEGEQRINMPYMTLRHCPMKSHLNATCATCPYKEGFKYVMQNGNTLKLKRQKLSSCTFYLTE